MTWAKSRPRMRSSELRSFCEPLWLPGWSDRSIWGYDEPSGSYFAQLWLDEDADTDPTVWISGRHRIRDSTQLAMMISTESGRDVVAVVRAMTHAETQGP